MAYALAEGRLAEACLGRTQSSSTAAFALIWNWKELQGKTVKYSQNIPYLSMLISAPLHQYRLGLDMPDLQDRQGLQCFSPLFDLLHEIDIVWDLPPDIFHLLWEGITRDKLKRMFINRVNKISKGLLNDLSQAYRATRVFSETPRRPHAIHVKSLKGSELALITMSVFPLLVERLMRSFDGGVW